MAEKQEKHSSAHPFLAPAKSEQVIQFLLARNYHLTALELLVESQASGHHGEFPELELFFSNTDRFPPEEVSRHAQSNPLDSQAIAREREHKLQLTEYELRLAKEDLANMSRKLAAASHPTTPTNASAGVSAARSAGGLGSPRFSLRPQGSEPLTTTSPALAGFLGNGMGGAEGQQKREGGSVSAGGQPTQGGKGSMSGGGSGLGADMALPNPFANGSVLPPGGSLAHTNSVQGGAGMQSGGASTDVDWSQLGTPSDAEHSVVLACVVSYCLHLGLRTTALTLREEAADALPGSNVGELLQSGKTEGLSLWRWFKLARTALAEQGSAALESRSGGAQLQAELDTAREQVAALQAALERAEADAAAARAAANTAAGQASALRQALEEARAANKSVAGGPAGGAEGPRSPPAMGLLAADSYDMHQVSPGPSANLAPFGSMRRSASAIVEHAMATAIVAQLTDLLPRIMPALTIKARLEILPMVQAVILAAQEPDTQRALTGLVFNGVATPDPMQRGAVVALCVGVAAQLGPAWAAQELLHSCTKQISSPSAERRVLVAEMIAALLNPAAVPPLGPGPGQGGHGGMFIGGAPPVVADGPLIDCATQSHALLTALHRLAEDRMEQVREAAVGSLIALLKPGCLAFSRTYYNTIEELLMQLVCDTESVSGLALDSLAPAIQGWTSGHPDLIATSLLPRVVSEVSRLCRDAGTALNAAQTQQSSSHPSNTQVVAASPSGGTGASGTLRESYSTPAGLPHLVVPPSPGPGGPGGGGQGPNPLTGRSSVVVGGAGRGSFVGAGQQAFNTQRYACWEHQAMYQLLQLYTLLLPSLRTSALQAVPPSIIAAATATAAGAHPAADGLPPEAQPFHSTSTAIEPGEADGLGAAAGKATHRSQPSLDANAGHNPNSTLGLSEGDLAHHRANSMGDAGPGSAGSSTHTFIVHSDAPGGGPLDYMGSVSGALGTTVSVTATAGGAENPLTQLNVVEMVESGELDGQALFAAAAQTKQWKRMQWVLQYLLPELIEMMKVLGSPTHLQLPGQPNQPTQPTQPPQPPPGTGGQHHHHHSQLSSSGTPQGGDAQGSGGSFTSPMGGIPTAISCGNLHKQMSKIVALTATTFGVGWTQSVLLPVFCSAAGCTALDLAPSGTTSAGGGISGGGGSGPLQEFVEQLGPQTPAAALIARTCVLPHVLCSVLPYAGPTAVSDWLLALTRVTHQDAPPSYQQLSPFFALYQAPGTPSHPQWLVLAQQQLAAAVGYACSTNSVVVSQVLQVLEHLAHSQPVPSSKGAAPVKLSGLTGALSLTLAQGLLPLMGSTPTSSTHSTTSITHHTSNAQTAAFPTTASGLEIGPAYMPAVPSSTPASTATAARPDSSNLNSNLKRGDVELPPMPLDSRGSLGSGYGSPAATPAPPLPPSGAGLAKKVMSLLMVMLSEGDQEVQCGVVLVLLEVLMRYRGGAGEDAKLVEQVCVVYDGLLASGSPPLVSSVLGAAQHLAVATAPTAARSAAAAQLLEWVLQSVLALASQLVPPPAGTAPLAPGAYDHQRHQAVQLLSVTHAAFMQDVQLPRLNTALQGCLKALASIRTLLPEPYAAVLTPMLANNRPAAGTAMANALSAAAAMSAIAAPPAVTVAQGLPAWAAAAAPPAYNQAAPATPAAAQQHPNLSPQQQQYLQSQRQQQAALAPTAGQYGAGQYGHHGSGTPPLAPPSAQPAVAPPVDNLSTRFEKLKSRFRKKADGEDGTAPA